VICGHPFLTLEMHSFALTVPTADIEKRHFFGPPWDVILKKSVSGLKMARKTRGKTQGSPKNIKIPPKKYRYCQKSQIEKIEKSAF